MLVFLFFIGMISCSAWVAPKLSKQIQGLGLTGTPISAMPVRKLEKGWDLEKSLLTNRLDSSK
jgi:hypothetical protein